MLATKAVLDMVIVMIFASTYGVGVQSPSEIKPPADCRGAQMYYVMQSMTRTSQQVRRGVLE